MSGHSKWSTIKRKKAATDAKRGAAFTKLSRVIYVAAKQGGADPDSNFKLRLAIDKAKAANLPADNIERAIKKGAGLIEGDETEELVYEGYGPGGVAVIVEATTSNKQRTAASLKHIFSKHGGSLGEPGSVKWMFKSKGVIALDVSKMEKVAIEELEMVIIDCGADDFRQEDGELYVFTKPGELKSVADSLAEKKVDPIDVSLKYIEKDSVELSEKDGEKIGKLMADLEEDDDVSEVYTNIQ